GPNRAADAQNTSASTKLPDALIASVAAGKLGWESARLMNMVRAKRRGAPIAPPIVTRATALNVSSTAPGYLRSIARPMPSKSDHEAMNGSQFQTVAAPLATSTTFTPSSVYP